RVGAVHEVDQCPTEGGAGRAGGDALGERDVELDDVRGELDDVLQAREPGAGVVDRDQGAGPTQAPQGLLEQVVVVDHGVLGDLDDQAPVGALDQVEEPRVGQGEGGGVDRQRRG